jgi:hypothetical protein
MGSLLNQTNCVDKNGNTGVSKCFFDPKKIRGAFISRTKFRIDGNDLQSTASIVAALAAAAVDIVSKRIFPVHGFEDIKSSGGDPKIQTLGYGGQYPSGENPYKWDFQFVDGGLCLHKQLRNFNKGKVYVLFYDDQGLLMGTIVDKGFESVPLSYFFQNAWQPSTGDNVASYIASFSFDTVYLNEGFSALSLAKTDLLNIAGLQDVLLTAVSRAAAVVQVVTGTSCGNENIGDTYGTELEDPDLWVATDDTTGLPLVITSVSYNAPNFVFTLDTTAPNYTASHRVRIALASAATLNTAGITGFEGFAPVVTAS